MKRRIVTFFTAFIASVTLIMAALGFTACKEKEAEPVVITVDERYAECETLLDVMTKMEEDGTLSFTVQNGMVTKMNGTKQTTKSFWMLYTSDEENSSTEWGAYVYEDVTYGSASYGAGDLPAKMGETYIWVYQTF